MNQEKQQWRQNMKALRNEISLQKRNQDSQAIRKQMMTQKEYQTAEEILLYVSVGSEVETKALIEQACFDGKKVFVPKVKEQGRMEFFLIHSVSELICGKYHIPEPIEGERFFPKQQKTPVIIVLPGLAFDYRGERLGYGKGYYDRYLQRIRQANCPYLALGLAFREQVFETIPTDPFDQRLDGIVTPDQVYHIKETRK